MDWSRIAITLIFFQWKLTIGTLHLGQFRSSKTELYVVISHVSQSSYKVSKFTSNLENPRFWNDTGAPFWAPFFTFSKNTSTHTFNIMWNQKSDQSDKKSSFYPKMKCPNRNFQKSGRALWFLEFENGDSELQTPFFTSRMFTRNQKIF